MILKPDWRTPLPFRCSCGEVYEELPVHPMPCRCGALVPSYDKSRNVGLFAPPLCAIKAVPWLDAVTGAMREGDVMPDAVVG